MTIPVRVKSAEPVFRIDCEMTGHAEVLPGSTGIANVWITDKTLYERLARIRQSHVSNRLVIIPAHFNVLRSRLAANNATGSFSSVGEEIRFDRDPDMRSGFSEPLPTI